MSGYDGVQAYLRESLEQIAEAVGVPTEVDGEPLPDGQVVDDIVHEVHLLQRTLANELALKQAAYDERDEVALPLPDDALLTLRQAATVLTVSYSTITKWTSRGEFCPLAFKLPNGEYRVRYRDLIRWALSFREGTP